MNCQFVNVILLLVLYMFPGQIQKMDTENHSILGKLSGRTISIPLFQKRFRINPNIKFAQDILKQNQTLIIECANNANISPKLLAATIYCECYFNPPELQLLEKCLLVLGAQINHLPDLSVGPAQIRLSTAHSYYQSSQKNRNFISHFILTKKTTALLLIDDQMNIELCARLLQFYQEWVLLSAKIPPSKQTLIEHCSTY